MARFEFRRTALPGVTAVRRNPIADARGWFGRLYCREEFAAAGISVAIAQINQSFTQASGALRGMHFQLPPHAESKYISCIRGRIFDVAIDLRQGSPTFLKWHGEILSAENRTGLVIPEGCAHGFQTLEPECELIYLHSEAYHPESERGVNARDPRIGVAWPLPVGDISAKDLAHQMLDEHYKGIAL